MHTCTLHSANTRFFLIRKPLELGNGIFSTPLLTLVLQHAPLLKITAFETSLLPSVVAFAAFEDSNCLDQHLRYANFSNLMLLQRFTVKAPDPAIRLHCLGKTLSVPTARLSENTFRSLSANCDSAVRNQTA